MQCVNHPHLSAYSRCAGCSEPFCSDCLVDIQGQFYCGSCKVMAVRGQPMHEEATIPCKEADEALKYAIIGIFCFGIILGPIAIAKALKAQGEIRSDPRLTGSGKATAALVIGIIVVILWVIGVIARISMMGQGRPGRF